MAWLDALLGKIRYEGVEVDLSGGLNFGNGLKAVRNPATGMIDIAAGGRLALEEFYDSINVGEINVTTLNVGPGGSRVDIGAGVLSLLRPLGYASCRLDATTAQTFLAADTWYALEGDYMGNTVNDSDFPFVGPGASFQWGGGETVRVRAHATVTLDPAGVNKTYAIAFRVNGVQVGEHSHVTPTITGDASLSLVELLAVEDGQTIDLVIANHTDTTACTVTHCSFVVEAIGDPLLSP
jgi:hypothetical protein